MFEAPEHEGKCGTDAQKRDEVRPKQVGESNGEGSLLTRQYGDALKLRYPRMMQPEEHHCGAACVDEDDRRRNRRRAGGDWFPPPDTVLRT